MHDFVIGLFINRYEFGITMTESNQQDMHNFLYPRSRLGIGSEPPLEQS